MSDFPTELDAYLASEFFRRHLERANGEPEIWHLTSREGTIQVLAYSRRLSPGRLARLRSDLVRRVIDHHEHVLVAANDEDDLERIPALESRLKDLHLFDVALGLIQGKEEEGLDTSFSFQFRQNGRETASRAPVWSDGRELNLATLQRLGLLAYPVLSDEELLQPDLMD